MFSHSNIIFVVPRYSTVFNELYYHLVVVFGDEDDGDDRGDDHGNDEANDEGNEAEGATNKSSGTVGSFTCLKEGWLKAMTNATTKMMKPTMKATKLRAQQIF